MSKQKHGLGLIIEKKGKNGRDRINDQINVMNGDTIEITVTPSIETTVFEIRCVDGFVAFVKYEYDPCPYCGGIAIMKPHGACTGCGFQREEPLWGK